MTTIDTLFAALVFLLLTFLIYYNWKDKKKYESDENQNYKKSKEDEGDMDID